MHNLKPFFLVSPEAPFSSIAFASDMALYSHIFYFQLFKQTQAVQV